MTVKLKGTELRLFRIDVVFFIMNFIAERPDDYTSVRNNVHRACKIGIVKLFGAVMILNGVSNSRCEVAYYNLLMKTVLLLIG